LAQHINNKELKELLFHRSDERINEANPKTGTGQKV
jgi:hypothetical protein